MERPMCELAGFIGTSYRRTHTKCTAPAKSSNADFTPVRHDEDDSISVPRDTNASLLKRWLLHGFRMREHDHAEPDRERSINRRCDLDLDRSRCAAGDDLDHRQSGDEEVREVPHSDRATIDAADEVLASHPVQHGEAEIDGAKH